MISNTSIESRRHTIENQTNWKVQQEYDRRTLQHPVIKQWLGSWAMLTMKIQTKVRVVPVIANLQRSNTFESLALAATPDLDRTYNLQSDPARLYPIEISITILTAGWLHPAQVTRCWSDRCVTGKWFHRSAVASRPPPHHHLITRDTDLLSSYFKIMTLLTENIYSHSSMKIYIEMQVHKYFHVSIWKRTIVFPKRMSYVF